MCNLKNTTQLLEQAQEQCSKEQFILIESYLMQSTTPLAQVFKRSAIQFLLDNPDTDKSRHWQELSVLVSTMAEEKDNA